MIRQLKQNWTIDSNTNHLIAIMTKFSITCACSSRSHTYLKEALIYKDLIWRCEYCAPICSEFSISSYHRLVETTKLRRSSEINPTIAMECPFKRNITRKQLLYTKIRLVTKQRVIKFVICHNSKNEFRFLNFSSL